MGSVLEILGSLIEVPFLGVGADLVSSLNTDSVASNLGEESSGWHLRNNVEVGVHNPAVLLVQLAGLVLTLELIKIS